MPSIVPVAGNAVVSRGRLRCPQHRLGVGAGMCAGERVGPNKSSSCNTFIIIIIITITIIAIHPSSFSGEQHCEHAHLLRLLKPSADYPEP